MPVRMTLYGVAVLCILSSVILTFVDWGDTFRIHVTNTLQYNGYATSLLKRTIYEQWRLIISQNERPLARGPTIGHYRARWC